MLEAPNGLIGDDHHDQDQGHRVAQAGQDAGPVVAVGVAGVGRPLGLHAGEPGQAERGDVGQHVAGIGEQGQGVREDAARQLDGEDDRREQEGGAQPRARHAMVVVGFSIRMGGATSINATKPGIEKAYGIRKLRDTLVLQRHLLDR
jgi:hypothetical protein